MVLSAEFAQNMLSVKLLKKPLYYWYSQNPSNLVFKGITVFNQLNYLNFQLNVNSV